jgi:abhydrolase domain-containing protein 17
MELDWLVFASPDTSYNYDRCNGELIFIPKCEESSISVLDSEKEEINPPGTRHIPCLFLRATTSSLCPKYALFFHGNAEDINLASEILNHIRFTLSINVIAPEYPGYGIYPGRPSEEQIFADSISVYNYLTETLKISQHNIIIFGRSLGTSPSTYLASKKDVSALILISPMMSIQAVVKDILGRLVAYTIKDRFQNIKMIEDVKCPILIIHGQNDTLIKYYHSTELYNKSKAPCELILPENMDHNEFDFFQEFSEPLLDFISRNAIFTYTQPCANKIPVEAMKVPDEFLKPYKQWNCLTKIFKRFNIS